MKKLILNGIRIYKYIGSPFLHCVLQMPFKSGCRFYPSCSDYAIEAVEKYGAWKGILRTVIRVFKCNPLSASPKANKLIS